MRRIRISCCSLCRVSCSQSVWNALQEWVLFLLWLLNMRFSGIFTAAFWKRVIRRRPLCSIVPRRGLFARSPPRGILKLLEYQGHRCAREGVSQRFPNCCRRFNACRSRGTVDKTSHCSCKSIGLRRACPPPVAARERRTESLPSRPDSHRLGPRHRNALPLRPKMFCSVPMSWKPVVPVSMTPERARSPENAA